MTAMRVQHAWMFAFTLTFISPHAYTHSPTLTHPSQAADSRGEYSQAVPPYSQPQHPTAAGERSSSAPPHVNVHEQRLPEGISVLFFACIHM